MNPKNSTFSYEIYYDLQDLNTLKSDWSRILRHIPNYFPTITFEWNYSWILANWDRIKELYIVVIKNIRQEVVGIVPFYIYTTKIFGIPLTVLDLIGSQYHGMIDIIAAPEHLLAVLNLLIKVIFKEAKRWDIGTFRRLNYMRGATVFLERIAEKKGLSFSEESFIRVPYIQLEGTWEDYYKQRDKHFKKEIRRKRRKLENNGEIRFEVLESPIDDGHFREFLHLEDKGWKGKEGTSLLKRDCLLSLYRNILKVGSNEIILPLVFNMRLNETLISSSICFKTLNGLYVFKIAYDEAFHYASPGLQLRLYEIEYSYRNGLKIYDFSGIEQPWMKKFTNRSHYSIDFILYKHHFPSLVRYLGFTKIAPYLKKFPFIFNAIKKRIQE